MRQKCLYGGFCSCFLKRPWECCRHGKLEGKYLFSVAWSCCKCSMYSKFLYQNAGKRRKNTNMTGGSTSLSTSWSSGAGGGHHTEKLSYPYLFVIFNRTSALPVKAKSHQVDHQQARQDLNACALHCSSLKKKKRVSPLPVSLKHSVVFDRCTIPSPSNWCTPQPQEAKWQYGDCNAYRQGIVTGIKEFVQQAGTLQNILPLNVQSTIRVTGNEVCCLNGFNLLIMSSTQKE